MASSGAFAATAAFPEAGGLGDDRVLVSLWTRQQLYFATHDLVTDPTDVPGNRPVEGRLRLPTWRSELAVDEVGRYAGAAVLGFGELVLENQDGAVDELTGTTVSDGGAVTLYVGAVRTDAYGRRYTPPLAEMAPLINAQAEQWTLGGDATVRLALRDTTLRLDVPVQTAFYGGSGGLSGGPELTGRPLPICYGYCQNITPDLIDAAQRIYRFNDLPSEEVVNVYDRRVLLVNAGDVATYEDLVDATPEAGTYRTCLDVSCFKLGSAPAGTVTADVRGGARFVEVSFFDDGARLGDGSGFAGYVANQYVSRTAQIIARLLTDRGLVSTAQVETTSFSRVDQTQPAEIGIYLDSGSSPTIRSVVNRLAAGIGASFGQALDGRYELHRLEAPPANPNAELTDDQIISLARANLAYRVPPAGWRVGFARNWTPMTAADVADAATEVSKQFVINRTTSYATRESSDIRSATVGRVSTVEGFFTELDPAANEAQRLLELYSLGRGLYEVELPLVGLLYPRGTFVLITYPQDPFRNGKSVVVVGVEVNLASNRTRLTVFG